VHGGPVPRRLADHLAALMRQGVLQPLAREHPTLRTPSP
jgi:hypothetical protein